MYQKMLNLNADYLTILKQCPKTLPQRLYNAFVIIIIIISFNQERATSLFPLNDIHCGLQHQVIAVLTRS